MAAAPMIHDQFRRRFGVAPQLVASAPGRVNLVGEHTDYNDGFALPMGIDRRVHVAIAPRTDHRLVAYSEAFDEERELDLSQPASGSGRQWSDYVGGVLRVMRHEGHRIPGMNIFVSKGVPVGAGVSSSAALEVAMARALCVAMDVTWEPVRMARLAQRAENEFVGVSCGIMDQITATTARAGSAMLLDCRSLSTTYVRMPPEVAIVVMDTGVRRTLSGSDYNARRSVCDYVVSRVRSLSPAVKALRDVTPALLETARVLLDSTAYRRARHVVDENSRPRALARALTAGDFAAAGDVLNQSHASLATLYEVSSVHLDLICEAARAHPACRGARMTGAGFGGCAIALVDADGAKQFIRDVRPEYEARSYKRAEFFVVQPDEGARLETFA